MAEEEKIWDSPSRTREELEHYRDAYFAARAEIRGLNVRVSELERKLELALDSEETRSDGKVVRRDRWENGLRNIAGILGMRDYEVHEVVERARSVLGSGSAESEKSPAAAEGEVVTGSA